MNNLPGGAQVYRVDLAGDAAATKWCRLTPLFGAVWRPRHLDAEKWMATGGLPSESPGFPRSPTAPRGVIYLTTCFSLRGQPASRAVNAGQAATVS
jgi:hypothetical protein